MVWADRGGLARSLFGRSACGHCRQALPPIHLIPIVSWLFLRGRCAFCKHRLSPVYPLFEAGVGFALALVWVRHLGWNPDLFLVDGHLWGLLARDVTFTIVLALLFIYDLRRMLLPDRITIPGIMIALVWNAVLGFPESDLALGGLFVGGFFLVQYLVSRGRWVGGGDVRMGVLLGVMLGLLGGIEAVFVAYILGALVALVLLALGRATRKTPLPFGTFLAVAGFVVLLWGRELLSFVF